MPFRVMQRLGWSCLLLMLTRTTMVADTGPTEYQIKAAMLVTFVQFVDWPSAAFSDSSAPFIVGILGDNPFGEDLPAIAKDKSMNTHPIIIKEYKSASQATNCHILFISASEKKHLREIIQTLQKSSVLTVGESDRLQESGCIVNLFPEGRKIRFEINATSAKAAGLKVSSHLLGLSAHPGR